MSPGSTRFPPGRSRQQVLYRRSRRLRGRDHHSWWSAGLSPVVGRRFGSAARNLPPSGQDPAFQLLALMGRMAITSPSGGRFWYCAYLSIRAATAESQTRSP